MLELLLGNVLTHDKSEKWIGSDNPSSYNKNCKDPDFKKEWENIDIKYILNSQGYRCPEWDEIIWQESIVIFGDSCITGVGVPNHHTLPAFLQTALRRPVINLGVAGSSNLFSLYNMTRMKTANINPYAVIDIDTTPERTLTFSKKGIENTGIDHWGIWRRDDVNYKNFWLGDQENYIKHNKYIKETKKLLWKETKYINYNSIWVELENTLPRIESNSRDRIHPGKDTYMVQAEHIKNDWIKNGWM